MKKIEALSLENMKSRNGLSVKGIELLEERKKELSKHKEANIKIINLKEGEAIKIQVADGNDMQNRIMVCYKNCILTKQEVDAIRPKLGTSISVVNTVTAE